MRAVELQEVRFRYRGADADALAGVGVHADAGERVAVVGLTGAGKSTLLKCVNRLVPASYRGEFAGKVALFGEEIAGKRVAELCGTVGMVLQDFESQLFSSAAELDAAFGPENLGLGGDEIRRRVTQSLRAVGMEHLRRRDPATLSGGQKQRLAIATVLSLHPRVLCLDEPTTDLDPEGREEIASLLKSLCGGGLTALLAEHEMDLLAGADRIVGLAAGKKMFDCAAGEVLWDPGLLSSFGVRPPDLAVVAGELGLVERPGTVDEAAALLKSNGIGIRPGAADELVRADAAAAQEGRELIRIEGLGHTYPGGVESLSGVDLTIRAGEFVAVLGRNGSGKTTLVKHINGLLKPTAGAVLIEGQDTRALKAAALGQRVGFVFQDPDHQIFAGRVFDEVAFAPRNHGLPEAGVKERVTRALAQVGLAGREDRDPFLLTKGERQRVALAGVLAAEPEVIILDEPTTGLDYPAQRAVMELLKALNNEGRTVIVITHAIGTAAEYARRIVVMSDAAVIGDGPGRRILSDEALLSRAGLKMPAILALGRAMGADTLTSAQFLAALDRGGT
ncbi:MAG TPA: energy-coupling factor transporter ATPase [bacterium]|nr:energy-coupling factor transporter ATPase [bacterium]